MKTPEVLSPAGNANDEAAMAAEDCFVAAAKTCAKKLAALGYTRAEIKREMKSLLSEIADEFAISI